MLPECINSFRVGMASRINARLIEMAAARDGAAKTGSGTALVVVKNAVVDAAFEKLGLQFLRRGAGLDKGARRSSHARRSAAGDRVNLSRPVGGGAVPPRLQPGGRIMTDAVRSSSPLLVAADLYVFAKTMPEIPHEYVIRRAGSVIFIGDGGHDRERGGGRAGVDAARLQTPDPGDGWRYWTMGPKWPFLINRARMEDEPPTV